MLKDSEGWQGIHENVNFLLLHLFCSKGLASTEFLVCLEFFMVTTWMYGHFVFYLPNVRQCQDHQEFLSDPEACD